MDAELKPCPFCGEAPEFETTTDQNDGCWCVACENCDFSLMGGPVGIGWWSTKERAAAAWNTRALTQAQPGWRAVPVEPTPEMCKAGFMCESNGFVIESPQDAPSMVWAAMIAAAPSESSGRAVTPKDRECRHKPDSHGSARGFAAPAPQGEGKT